MSKLQLPLIADSLSQIKHKNNRKLVLNNMTIKDIEFKLKDGRTAILRSANEKDAKAFIEYMKKSTGETDFLLRTPEECETQTIEQEIFIFYL